MTTFWFIVIALLWTGFVVLEGFDFGVGALHGVVGQDEAGRQRALGTIGPVWDGNEVWLITAGAAMFAAFPGWYATMFSGFYLALVLLLVGLILRGTAIEFRGKRDGLVWRRWWSVALVGSGIVVPLLVGVALADLLKGLPIDAQQEYAGSFWDLLSAYSLFAGATFVGMTLLHGAVFLMMRGGPAVGARAAVVARRLAPAVAVVVVAFVIWTHVVGGAGVLLGLFELVAVGAALSAVWLVWQAQAGWAFVATTATLAATVLAIFGNLFPRVMVSSLGPANDLTTSNTSSAPYALKVLTVVLLVLFPIVLGYQSWAYRVFRRRSTSSTASSP